MELVINSAKCINNEQISDPISRFISNFNPIEESTTIKEITRKRCIHGRQKSHCKECGGSGICVHQRQKSKCKECGGSSICEHQRIRATCKECSGSSICEHKRIRYQCKECGGGSICEHQRRRSTCKDCKPDVYVSINNADKNAKNVY